MARKFVVKHIRTKHEEKLQAERERVCGVCICVHEQAGLHLLPLPLLLLLCPAPPRPTPPHPQILDELFFEAFKAFKEEEARMMEEGPARHPRRGGREVRGARPALARRPGRAQARSLACTCPFM